MPGLRPQNRLSALCPLPCLLPCLLPCSRSRGGETQSGGQQLASQGRLLQVHHHHPQTSPLLPLSSPSPPAYPSPPPLLPRCSQCSSPLLGRKSSLCGSSLVCSSRCGRRLSQMLGDSGGSWGATGGGRDKNSPTLDSSPTSGRWGGGRDTSSPTSGHLAPLTPLQRLEAHTPLKGF